MLWSLGRRHRLYTRGGILAALILVVWSLWHLLWPVAEISEPVPRPKPYAPLAVVASKHQPPDHRDDDASSHEESADRRVDSGTPNRPSTLSETLLLLEGLRDFGILSSSEYDSAEGKALHVHPSADHPDSRIARAMKHQYVISIAERPDETTAGRSGSSQATLSSSLLAKQAQDRKEIAAEPPAGNAPESLPSEPPPDDDPGQPLSSDKLKVRRLQQLSRLVKKFQKSREEAAQKAMAGQSVASAETRENRTRAIEMIDELRVWLKDTASIDASGYSGMNVIKVATMVLKKTANQTKDVQGIGSFPISRILNLTKTNSYALIKLKVNATHIRLSTDWIHDPKGWAVWDGLAPARRPTTGKRPCIVIPFHMGDMGRFPSAFYRWGNIETGKRRSKQRDMAVVMAYNSDLSTPDGQRIKAALLRLWMQYVEPSGHGPALHFLSLNQPALNHFDGAAISFYQLAVFLPPYFFSMILIETDVNPVKSGWFAGLEAAAATGCDWWQKGSAAMCDPWYFGELAKRHDFHINGNGHYAIGCPGFQDYLVKVQKYYPPQVHLRKCCCEVMGGCETNDPGGVELGYDHALFQYRMQPENFDFARQVMSRFRYTSEIYNMCEHAWTDYNQRLIIPNETLVVHSKYGLLTTAEKMIWRVENEILDRRPGWNELSNHLTPVVSGEVSETDLVNELCNSQEYQNMRSPNNICEARNVTEVAWADRMPGKAYLWSVDFHSGPSSCNLGLFSKAGAVVHCETDYGLCKHHGMCPRRLDVLSVDDNRGFALKSARHPNPADLVDAFYDQFHGTPEFDRVDAFICSHPVANCELFLPFKKPLIMYATTRFEFGRHDRYIDWRQPDWSQDEGQQRWREWLNTTVTLHRNPANVLAANNMYDAKYIEYFTGIEPIYIPTWCGGQNDALARILEGKLGVQGDYTASYSPFHNSVLIGPYRTNLERSRFNGSLYPSVEDHPLVSQLRAAISRFNQSKTRPLKNAGKSKRKGWAQNKTFEFEFVSARHKDGYYTSDLAAHPAMVFIPYQVSTIFIHEVYRMNIPMYFPDQALLKQWWSSHDILWERMYGTPEQVTAPGLFPRTSWPDPNENSEASFDFWMKWCDWYVLPHIRLFSSWDDLMRKIHTDDMFTISEKMAAANRQNELELISTWKNIFEEIKDAGKALRKN